MNLFLNDFLQTLSSQQLRQANSLLAEAKTEKSNLKALANKLATGISSSSIRLNQVGERSLVSGSKLAGDFETVFLALEEIYAVLNTASDLTSSNIAILLAEIKALETELDALEKGIDNYGFLMTDSKAYDFAYLETFDDERGVDEFDFRLTDRAEQIFFPYQKAGINTEEGVLSLLQFGVLGTIPEEPGLTTSATQTPGPKVFPIATASIFKSNATSLVATDTGINNLLSPLSETGWKLGVESPTIIRQDLPEFTSQYGTTNSAGLQVIAEFTVQQAAPIDFLAIKASTSFPFQVVQIRLFPEKNNYDNYVDVLEDPESVTGVKYFRFPTQSVHKIHLYIRKETYSRPVRAPLVPEVTYRRIWNPNGTEFTGGTGGPTWVGELSDSGGQGPGFRDYQSSNRMAMLDIDRSALGQERSKYANSYPSKMFEPRWGILRANGGLVKRGTLNPDPWDASNYLTTAMYDILRRVMATEGVLGFTFFNNFRQKKSGAVLGHNNEDYTKNMDPFTPAILRTANVDSMEPRVFARYRYDIGIQQIAIGLGAYQTKGYFISKPMNADGDIGQVKIKVSDSDYYIPNTDRDTGQVTSIEYSISNSSDPRTESSWIPILPTGVSEVSGERFFPDVTGYGEFRFPASVEGTVRVYRNGYAVEYSLQDVLVRPEGKAYYIGARLPLGSWNTQDIFTVDYFPAWAHDVVDFSSSFDQKPLLSAFDDDGSGESFTGTGGSLEITLQNEPYINYELVDASTYSLTSGLSGYSPITVSLDDGTVAYNLTNYQGGTQATLDSSSDDYQYLQSGNKIVFNKAITQGFKVHYKFLPSNIRIRAILRCNYSEFISPKVDYIQLKAKTRKPDLRQMS